MAAFNRILRGKILPDEWLAYVLFDFFSPFLKEKKKGKNSPCGHSAAASKLLCARSAICLLLSRVKAFHSFYFCQSRDSGTSFWWTQAPYKQNREEKKSSKDLGGTITWIGGSGTKVRKQGIQEGNRIGPIDSLLHDAVCNRCRVHRWFLFIFRTCV